MKRTVGQVVNPTSTQHRNPALDLKTQSLHPKKDKTLQGHMERALRDNYSARSLNFIGDVAGAVTVARAGAAEHTGGASSFEKLCLGSSGSGLQGLACRMWV